MAARKGDLAKQLITDKIVEVFGAENIVLQDKKVYIWIQDGPGGERVQIALSLTLPKTPVSAGASVSSDQAAWDSAPQGNPAAIPATPAPVQLSAEDKAKVDELMAKLGL